MRSYWNVASPLPLLRRFPCNRTLLPTGTVAFPVRSHCCLPFLLWRTNEPGVVPGWTHPVTKDLKRLPRRLARYQIKATPPTPPATRPIIRPLLP